MNAVYALILLCLTAVPAAAAAPPTVETFKQALTQRLVKLKPADVTQRDVLYQDVRAGATTAGSYQYQVTAIIRDYGPGYPANRYYGQTCVKHFDKALFTMSPDGFGGLQVEGAMTPPLDKQTCKPNPSAGVSAFPLAGLPGSPAQAGNPAAPPAAAAPAQASKGMLPGSYECWANGEARMLLNFTVRSDTQYVGSDGKAGNYRYDKGTGRVTFQGGALDGVLPNGFFTVYHAPQGLPTLSFRSPSGNEASFCQKAR